MKNTSQISQFILPFHLSNICSTCKFFATYLMGVLRHSEFAIFCTVVAYQLFDQLQIQQSDRLHNTEILDSEIKIS